MSKVAAKRRRKPSAEKIRAAKAKRAELAALSRAIKPALAAGMFGDCDTVNQALLVIYTKQSGQTDFKKFKDWKEAGYSVRKGESAFRVWARPRKIKGTHTDEARKEGQDEFDWFPICCLFHAGQVEDGQGKPPVSFVLPVFQPLPLALPGPGESTAHQMAS